MQLNRIGPNVYKYSYLHSLAMITSHSFSFDVQYTQRLRLRVEPSLLPVIGSRVLPGNISSFHRRRSERVRGLNFVQYAEAKTIIDSIRSDIASHLRAWWYGPLPAEIWIAPQPRNTSSCKRNQQAQSGFF